MEAWLEYGPRCRALALSTHRILRQNSSYEYDNNPLSGGAKTGKMAWSVTGRSDRNMQWFWTACLRKGVPETDWLAFQAPFWSEHPA